ncbi:MAG: glycosyltransferase family A protein [Pseudomonadales bacterium]
MADPRTSRNRTGHWQERITGLFLKFAASGWISPRLFEPDLPPPELRAARRGRLTLEIVSHCWQYAQLLIYQLSSLVRYPPQQLDVIMTVYYNEEDVDTHKLLKRFAALSVNGVQWNWCAIPQSSLFRRAIGRNHTALHSTADWIWFTDCDLMFAEGCLDTLAERLQGSRDALCFPQVEHVTSLLPAEHPMLNPDIDSTLPLCPDLTAFAEYRRTRATGPLQITHGDVARACGYCNALPYYQKPASTWRKAHEDRAFRWLLQTQGTPLAVPGVYRIRHASKGRYTGHPILTWIRGGLRRLVSTWQERLASP